MHMMVFLPPLILDLYMYYSMEMTSYVIKLLQIVWIPLKKEIRNISLQSQIRYKVL